MDTCMGKVLWVKKRKKTSIHNPIYWLKILTNPTESQQQQWTEQTLMKKCAESRKSLEFQTKTQKL